MALLDEQIIEEWLNSKNFFTMRGVKIGINEIDLLAVNPTTNQYWHVECQISFRPIGYIGGDTSAKTRELPDILAGVAQYVDKKFSNQKKIDKRNEIVPNAKWEYILVHAELKDTQELKMMNDVGVKTIHYKEVIKALQDDRSWKSSSQANMIMELLNYIK